MKEITKEKIDECVTETKTKILQNVSNILLNNIEDHKIEIENSTQLYAMYLGILFTSMDASEHIIRESLYELLEV